MEDLQGAAADEWPEDRVDTMQEHDLEGVLRSSQQQTICTGCSGFEPRTSRTLRENHTTRPHSQVIHNENHLLL